MKITCISDLHGHFPSLSGGDLLIIAGDLMPNDSKKNYDLFNLWICTQEYTEKIFVPGNHDVMVQGNEEILSSLRDNCVVLIDSGTVFEGIKIWGSPWTKSFPGMNPHCNAFTFDKEEELDTKFSLIPENTDILITHCPPYGIMDSVESWNDIVNVGSLSLLKRVNEVRPKLHVFGHIHEGHGTQFTNDTIFVNASHMNRIYKPVNGPVDVHLKNEIAESEFYESNTNIF